MLVKDLGKISEDVYAPERVSVFPLLFQVSSGSWNSFQAGAYSLGGSIVVAFRGTVTGGDGVSDLALGIGANSAYFSAGEEFVRKVATVLGRPVAMVCGHSLGGAIAQVVANRLNLPMVSFNAPGVGVLASKNIASATAGATAIRTAGMLASAVVRPGQALRDVAAAFRSVSGVNIRLEGDPVSRVGVHYGNVRNLPRTSIENLVQQGIISADLSLPMKLYKAHSMATLNLVLQRSYGSLEVPVD